MSEPAILEQIVSRLGLILEGREELPGAMSGSWVRAVRTSSGREAVLKVTLHRTPDGTAQARREHRAYTLLRPSLPIRLPEVWHAECDDERTVLVLRRYAPARPASRWTRADWEAAVDTLIALHQYPLPGDRAAWTWTPWRGLDPVDDRAAIDALWADDGTQRALSGVLRSRDELEMIAATGAPESLTHGDFHTGNIVGDEGCPIVTDWASARIGPGTDDLAFLLLRASVEATERPPRDDVVERYATGRGLSPRAVERAVSARQTLTLALQYPAFRPYLDDATSGRLPALFAECALRW